MMDLRICLYTETALPMMGGQELVVDALARRFASRGHEVTVLAPPPRHPLRKDDSLLPYSVRRHYRFISTRRCLDWYAWFLDRVHRKHPFDVLHCHSVYPTGYVAARAKRLGHVPVVITSHFDDIAPTSRLLNKPLLPPRFRLALERADSLIAINGVVEKRVGQLCPDARRMERIPNGVDVAQFACPVTRPRDVPAAVVPKNYLLYLGRLVRRKGVDLLLEAFAGLSSYNQPTLLICGDGPERANLEAQTSRLGLGNRVLFLGQVEGDTKTHLLQNGLCTVLPSRISEGSPLVVLETYAAGRPVIGTSVPGLKEAIVPNRTGLHVPPESPGALTTALSRLVAEADWANRLGERARRFAADHDWQQIADRHLALFRELLEEKAVSACLA